MVNIEEPCSATFGKADNDDLRLSRPAVAALPPYVMQWQKWLCLNGQFAAALGLFLRQRQNVKLFRQLSACVSTNADFSCCRNLLPTSNDTFSQCLDTSLTIQALPEK